MRSILITLVAALAALSFGTAASAAPAAVLGATYAATVATTVGAGTTLAVPVTLTNTGDEVWTTGGTNPVNLSYHWYTTGGAVVAWDGGSAPARIEALPLVSCV